MYQDEINNEQQVNTGFFFFLCSGYHIMSMYCLEASVLLCAKCMPMFSARTLSRSIVPVHISLVLYLLLWQVLFTGARTGKGILGERGYVSALATTNVGTKQ